MKVLILITYIVIVTAEFTQNLDYVEAFIQQKNFVRYQLKKKYRPIYHISAPLGWLNTPSGFVYFKRQYHIFYQYHPYKGAWGAMHWGHAVSENLVEWFHYPPVLIPKDYYDRHGCLSGSAIVHNNYLTLFYTGHVMQNNKTRQTQNMAISADGIIFQKYLYNPVIRQPPIGIGDFRNPKVWRFRQTWYMVVGTTTSDERGQLVLYTSKDLFNWTLNGTLARSYGDMGYMWENPEIFEVDGQYVLILSVQGIRPELNRFKNLFQTGYIIGNFNYVWARFEDVEISTDTFNELDYGHDFYGVQTMQAVDGRRLLIGWMGMWESDFLESSYGWASMLTLIREVRLNVRGKILMNPIREIEELRSEILESAWYSPGEAFAAGTKYFELMLNATTALYDVGLIFEWGSDRRLTVGYSSERGVVSVDRGGKDGIRRADWSPPSHIYWRIFVDASSIEIFCGNGEVVFTSRFYPKKSMKIVIAGETQVHILQYKLRRSLNYDEKLREYLKKYLVKYK